MWDRKEIIAEKLGDLSSLSNYESKFGEGDTGELHLYLDRILYANEITQLEQMIIRQGVVLTEPIVQDARMVVIKFRKEIAPLLIIGGAVVAIVGSVLGWQIWKTSQMGVPVWVWGVGGIALLYLMTRTKAGQGGITISKAYITRKALQ